MASDYKYLGLGLVSGVGATSLLVLLLALTPNTPAATIPGSRPTSALNTPFFSTPSTATSTPTSMWTITPQPTIVLSPTATLTQLDYLESTGQLYFAGSLSEERQELLYRSAIQYIAASPEESLSMAKQINGVEYGNPANTCGPLALSIMRDAGLVGQDVMPHDFWLLNPWLPADRKMLNDTLGVQNFDHFVLHEWLSAVDWTKFPLQPGDFLYIKAGGGGNFDHMLVVSRMDRQMRAYAVTNYRRPDGFVIDEVLLYDPAAPKAGIFAAWTARANAELGSTGFGGFELWRPTFR